MKKTLLISLILLILGVGNLGQCAERAVPLLSQLPNVTLSTNCSTYIGYGQFCYNTGTGVLYLGDGSAANAVAALNLASPPPIGGTAPNTGAFTSIIGTSAAITGPLTGAIGIKYVAAGAYTVGTTSANEAYGYLIIVQNTGTMTTPVWGSGKSFCAYSEGAYVVRVNPNGAEYIRLNGTLQATGVDIYSSGTAGDYICLVANTTNVWTTLGRSGTWTQGSSFDDGVGLFLLIGAFLGTLWGGWKLGTGRKAGIIE
jgi:hypothetical protein